MEIQTLTKKTIDFIVDGRTDFESIRPELLSSTEFTGDVLSQFNRSSKFTLLDIGGSSGEKIALPAKNAYNGSVYVVDPLAYPSLKGKVEVIAKAFDGNIDFLKEEDENNVLALVNLRTNYNVSYDVVDLAMKNSNVCFVALQPVYTHIDIKKMLPKSRDLRFISKFVKNYGSSLKDCVHEFTEPFALNNLARHERNSAFKQLYVCDMANALQEKGFSVNVFYDKYYVGTNHRKMPEDSEHFLLARK